MTTQAELNLFGEHQKVEPSKEVKGMVHNPDHHTSVEAAKRVSKGRSELQQRVLEAFGRHGPMTDEELEKLFPEYGATTVSKRRTELYQLGLLVQDGTKKNSRGSTMKVWKCR